MEGEPEEGGGCAAGKGVTAEQPAGDGLEDPAGRHAAQAVEDERVGDVEHAGRQAAQEDGLEGRRDSANGVRMTPRALCDVAATGETVAAGLGFSTMSDCQLPDDAHELRAFRLADLELVERLQHQSATACLKWSSVMPSP